MRRIQMTVSGALRLTAPVLAAVIVASSASPAGATTALAAAAYDPSICVLPTGMLDGTASSDQVGASAVGDSEDVISGLVNFGLSIASNFAGDVATDGAGWVLNLLLGNNTGGNSTDISQVLGDEQKDFDALQDQLSQLQGSLATDTLSLTKTAHWEGYADALQSADDDISQMQTAVQNLCVFSLSSELDTSEVTNVLGGISGNTTGPLNDLNDHLMGTGGQDGLISAYSQVVWDSLTPDTMQVPDRQLLNSEYLDKMQRFVNYFFALAVQYMNAYTEAQHWNTTGPVPDSTTNLLDVYYDQLAGDPNAEQPFAGDVNTWAAEGYDSIVSIPDNYLVDTRNNTAWSSPITLADSNSSTYCLEVSAPCVYNVWQSDDTTMATSTVVPSVVSVASQLDAQYPQWSVPTVSAWNALLASGSDGSDPADSVATWAAANNFPALQTRSITTPTGRASTITPVLVSDPATQAITFNTQTGSNKTAAGAGSYAGQLVLISQIGENTPIAQRPNLFAAAPTDAARNFDGVGEGVSGSPSRPSAAGGTKLGASGIVGTVGTQTIFDSPQSCSANGFTQPAGANAVRVTVIGGSGGNGTSGNRSGNAGGIGGQIVATIPLSAGATLYAQVGGDGGDSFYSGNDGGGEGTWNPGAGGLGGGAEGGTVIQPFSDSSEKPGAGGGGGGFSGLTSDPTCSQWLVIAGGGGGAGGLDSHNTATNGGNACVRTECTGQSPTRTGNDTGAGTGGSIISAGSAGEHDGNYAGNGTNGTLTAGGVGGVGGNGSENPLHDWGGGSGGGGGGGWGGGGGGGGSTGDYAGAGGGGGGSYLAAGISTATFTPAPSGVGPSVALTPVVSPEYALTQTDGHIWENENGVASAGNPIVSAAAADNGADQQWALLATPNAAYQIVNPATSMCASSATPTLTLATCVSTTSTATDGQAWTFVDTDGFGYAIETDTGQAALGTAGDSAPITIGNFTVANNSTWNIALANSSIWSSADTASVLHDVSLTDPAPDQPGSNTPHPPAPQNEPSANSTGHLAATGQAAAPVIVGGVSGLIFVGLGLTLIWHRRRRTL